MEEKDLMPLLDKIHNAADVRKLSRSQLPELCREVRQTLIDTVSKTAGHLASGLGVVELTVALHYVFDTPDDFLIWDVGHQAYPHKILTGHRKELATIRQKGGLHAFIWRGETPYDVLSTGHASTSIGSALGIAVAQHQLGTKRQVVAVIGDGALSGGMAFEALNHAGAFMDKGVNLLVILNDNEMSISENVGGLAKGLSRVLSNPHYAKLVEGGKKVLEKLPAVRRFALRAQEHVKGMIMPGTLFEEFGFNYIGPVDGHDVKGLVQILQNVKEIGGLQFLHVVTCKGKGYPPAEKDPICYHGVPRFDPAEGVHPTPFPSDRSFSAVFGRWMCDKAAQNDKLVGITPAMRIGSALDEFAKRYPDRFFDVAIAEEHSLVFASGLAAGGMRPVVAIYSTFLQRAYDSVFHDLALQDLPIMLAIDRAGVVGPDGPTHHGAFDIAALKAIPNLTIMAPSSRDELYKMLNTGFKLGHPCAVRYPRTEGAGELDGITLDDTVEIGKGRVLSEGAKIAVLCFGVFSQDYLEYAKERGYTLVDMRFIKPWDEALVEDLIKTHDRIITVEDGVVKGGIGEEIASFVQRKIGDRKVKVLNLGLPDRYIMEGTRKEIIHDLKLDVSGLDETVAAFLKE